MGKGEAAVDEKEEGEIDSQRLGLLLEEWKTVIQTQMHFNDMLMKMRTAAISVVVAIFGATAVIIGQFPDRYLEIFSRQVHVSAIVILFGLALWVGIFIIDYMYYYKMLLGAVQRGYEFDKAFSNTKLYKDLCLFGLSTKIRDAIGKPGASKCYIFIFYGVVLVIAVAYLLLVILSMSPSSSP